LIGLLLSPKNKSLPFPLIFTGPESARSYFEEIDDFLVLTLGPGVRSLYSIVIADAEEAAERVLDGIRRVRKFRKSRGDAYYFNWLLEVPEALQRRFLPTHESMAGLNLDRDQAPEALSFELRKAFSGIVAGSIKAQGLAEIDAKGPFQISGDPKIMSAMSALLEKFVAQKRLKLPIENRRPCFEVVT
jgi:hypothetical protein